MIDDSGDASLCVCVCVFVSMWCMWISRPPERYHGTGGGVCLASVRLFRPYFCDFSRFLVPSIDIYVVHVDFTSHNILPVRRAELQGRHARSMLLVLVLHVATQGQLSPRLASDSNLLDAWCLIGAP